MHWSGWIAVLPLVIFIGCKHRLVEHKGFGYQSAKVDVKALESQAEEGDRDSAVRLGLAYVAIFEKTRDKNDLASALSYRDKALKSAKNTGEKIEVLGVFAKMMAYEYPQQSYLDYKQAAELGSVKEALIFASFLNLAPKIDAHIAFPEVAKKLKNPTKTLSREEKAELTAVLRSLAKPTLLNCLVKHNDERCEKAYWNFGSSYEEMQAFLKEASEGGSTYATNEIKSQLVSQKAALDREAFFAKPLPYDGVFSNFCLEWTGQEVNANFSGFERMKETGNHVWTAFFDDRIAKNLWNANFAVAEFLTEAIVLQKLTREKRELVVCHTIRDKGRPTSVQPMAYFVVVPQEMAEDVESMLTKRYGKPTDTLKKEMDFDKMYHLNIRKSDKIGYVVSGVSVAMNNLGSNPFHGYGVRYFRGDYLDDFVRSVSLEKEQSVKDAASKKANEKAKKEEKILDSL